MGIQAQENFLEPFEVQKVRKIGQKQLFFHKNDRIIVVFTPLEIVPNFKKQLDFTFEVLDHDCGIARYPHLLCLIDMISKKVTNTCIWC